MNSKQGEASLSTFTMRKKMLVLWGAFDLIYVSWFIFESINKVRIPYVTDAISMVEVVGDVGGFFPAVVALVSLLFQLSIILTAFLLLSGNRRAKLVCFIQLPLRLLFIVPSISVILIAVNFADGYSIPLMLALVGLSEVIKSYTLWKFVD